MVINFTIESLKQDMRYINDLIGYEGIGACEEAALQLVGRMESLLETTTNEKVANFVLDNYCSYKGLYDLAHDINMA